MVRWRTHVTVPLDALHQPVNPFINTSTGDATNILPNSGGYLAGVEAFVATSKLGLGSLQAKDEDKELIFLEQVLVEAVEEGEHDSLTEVPILQGMCLRGEAHKVKPVLAITSVNPNTECTDLHSGDMTQYHTTLELPIKKNKVWTCALETQQQVTCLPQLATWTVPEPTSPSQERQVTGTVSQGSRASRPRWNIHMAFTGRSTGVISHEFGCLKVFR
ncbi:hypothetical protein E2C01_022301 [Portunus trituberculatus]|uniref:Uncharacterized protein n=1 Tax=Portunus trituberculatus TaxID=210409 RepID=A0A5B7E6X3_PORTR|nr:hypothetical protein [Portunus trituberculatus]